MKTSKPPKKIKEVVIGMPVVVNNLIVGPVYTVAEKKGLQVHLKYMSGDTEVSGGWIDKRVLMSPTKEQLKHAGIAV